MRKIVAFRMADSIPDGARPLGVIQRLVQPSTPGGAPMEELFFFYDTPQIPEIPKKEEDNGSSSGRFFQGKGPKRS